MSRPMDLVAFLVVAFVGVPFVLGLLAGSPRGYWAWGAIALVMAAMQATSGEILFFTLLVVFLGACGALPVAIGASVRRRWLRKHRATTPVSRI